MHKVTDRSSVHTEFSLPVMAKVCSAPGDWLPEPSDEKIPQLSETAQLDPLYLFACRLFWHKDADAAAAWELIHGLKSPDEGTRVLVSALLSKRKSAREIGVAQARGMSAAPRCRS